VLAYPGCSGEKAIKWVSYLLLYCASIGDWTENVWCTHSGWEPGASDGLHGRRRLVDDAPGQHTAALSRQHISAPPGCRHWAVRQQDAWWVHV